MAGGLQQAGGDQEAERGSHRRQSSRDGEAEGPRDLQREAGGGVGWGEAKR